MTSSVKLFVITDMFAPISPMESMIAIGITWLCKRVELMLIFNVLLLPRMVDQEEFVVES
ncbi:MAG: hypothetical protein AM324_009360 [Candidatus Thorarchaeota archaeon SMTZ1-83]